MKCGQTFKTNLREHFVSFKVHPEPMHVADRACRIAMKLMAMNYVVDFKEASDNPVLKGFTVSDSIQNVCKFASFWAVCSSRGNIFEENFILEFKDDVK